MPSAFHVTVRWRVGASAIALVLLVGLSMAVEQGLTMPIDLAVNAAFAPYRTPALLAAFLWITTMGTGACRLAMAGSASAMLWSAGRTALLRPLWITVIGTEATVWATKFAVDRPRPAFLPGVATASSPSFPSAHSAGTLAIVGILAVLVASHRTGRAERAAVWGIAAAVVLLIGFSRLFLNVHYLSDVASGFLVGGLWLLLGSATVGPCWSHEGKPISEPKRS